MRTYACRILARSLRSVQWTLLYPASSPSSLRLGLPCATAIAIFDNIRFFCLHDDTFTTVFPLSFRLCFCILPVFSSQVLPLYLSNPGCIYISSDTIHVLRRLPPHHCTTQRTLLFKILHFERHPPVTI